MSASNSQSIRGTGARTWYSRWLRGTTSSTVTNGGFCFSCSLIGGFSLQSWCVQGSIGSAEGSVLPPSDREQCGKIVGGYEGSTKTSKLLSEKAHKS